MERRTVTIKWDQLDDFNDDDDEFFESTNRLSAVVPLDMPLSEFDDNDDDDQEFSDTRVSFSNNLASNSIKPPSDFQYDMWMVAPGSITDRRRRLLQGMGLNSNKDFAPLPTTTSIKSNKAYTKRLVSTEPAVTPPETNVENEKPNAFDQMVKESSTHVVESKKSEQKQPESQPQPQDQTPVEAEPQPESKPQPQPQLEPEPKVQPQLYPKPELKAQPQPHVQVQVHEVQAQSEAKAQNSSLPVLLIRSRSDGDIDTSSLYTKQRKVEMIGSISKQCLTRTSSELVTPSVGLSCQYANIIRVSTPNTELPNKSSAATTMNKNTTQPAATSPQLDSFFLIKNLDTGKEFVVKESNDEGMWNKVSDLQTGKQLTMDEFEKTVGHSPVVKELMRRASHKRNGNANSKLAATNSYLSKSFRNSKKKGAAFLKNLKGSMSGSKPEKEKDDSATTTTNEQKSSEKQIKTTEKQKTSENQKTTEKQKTSEKQKTTEKQKTSEKQKASGEQKTNGEQKASTDKNTGSEWVKARAHGKPNKEFSALLICQEIQAHDGSIWTMRFTFDGHYLATAGEDKVIHVWEVQECNVMSMRSGDDKGSVTPDNRPPLPDSSATAPDKKKKAKNSKKKSGIPDYAKVPETMFGLSEKPVCTLNGHQDDVLDLSWSRSQHLLSSSMDKTVRLWDIETKNCLKQFAHGDYVTCIHFNPTDDDYFISGSLDTKVRMWSIPSRKVVDWSDLHDMITSVCYHPDGQGAIVGLHKGNCKSYSTTDCKLQQKDQIELHTKPKAEPKKITGFQFSPTNPSEVLVTSADSRIRILDGEHVVDKLIGYKNTSSQFSAQYSADGKYVICASEDSQVYIWKHEKPKNASGAKPKYVTTTSYEHFPCTDVTVALPWPGSSKLQRLDNEPRSKRDSKRSGPPHPTSDENLQAKTKSSRLPPVPKKSNEKGTNPAVDDLEQPSHTDLSAGESGNVSSRLDGGNNNNVQSTAWGLAIVTAGVSGEIRVYQNVGLPVKVGTNLF